jgi:hypothetical protein
LSPRALIAGVRTPMQRMIPWGSARYFIQKFARFRLSKFLVIRLSAQARRRHRSWIMSLDSDCRSFW